MEQSIKLERKLEELNRSVSILVNSISIIGAGSWGTANAISLAKKNIDVLLWVREKELLNNITNSRTNDTYLPDVYIPDNISVSDDIEKVCNKSDIVVIATPSHIVRRITQVIKPYIKKEQIIVNLAKGIENDSLLRMSQVIEEYLPNNKIVTLSGPSHAEEVAKDIPTTVVVSSKSRQAAEFVQDAFMTPRFRVYTNPDLIGVELGGALKNIIALGAGIIDGLGYGDNTKAAIMTRGIVEMARLGVSLGAYRTTFAGLSGIGDLIVTCTSMHSRNRRAGIAIGQGKSMEEVVNSTKMVVEGIKTTKSAYELAKKQNIEMPITEEIYNVLYEGKDVLNCVTNLMMRNKTHEIEDIEELRDINW